MVAGKILGVTAALSAVSQYCTLGEKIEDTSQGTCRTSAGLRTIRIIATGVDIVPRLRKKARCLTYGFQSITIN